eukprot:11488282-Prorocentrum_lima.AAC.1
MLREKDEPSPASSTPPLASDSVEPSGVLLQVLAKEEALPTTHNKPSLNDIALVTGTSAADKARH